jgi:hypothetical protein
MSALFCINISRHEQGAENRRGLTLFAGNTISIAIISGLSFQLGKFLSE